MPKGRLAGLDYWRALLPLVGVVYHAMVRVGGDAQFRWLEVWALAPHSFRMEAFFALAGLLAGTRMAKPGYLLSRWRVLLVPAGVLWICVVVAQPHHGLGPFRSGDAHLWFLFTLAQLVTVAVVAERAGWIERCLPHWRLTLTGCLVWALGARLCGLTMWHYPMTLLDTTRLAIYYAPFLLIGIVVARIPHVISSPRSFRWAAILGFLASFSLSLFLLLQEVPVPNHMVEDRIYSVLLTAIAALWVFGLLGTSMDRSISPAAVPIRWLAEASFTIYLLHWPIIALTDDAVRDWPFAVRFPLCIVAGAAIPLVIHACVERVPLLRLLLNGIWPSSGRWLWQAPRVAKRATAAPHHAAIGATSTLTSIACAPEPSTTPSTGAISA